MQYQWTNVYHVTAAPFSGWSIIFLQKSSFHPCAFPVSSACCWQVFPISLFPPSLSFFHGPPGPVTQLSCAKLYCYFSIAIAQLPHSALKYILLLIGLLFPSPSIFHSALWGVHFFISLHFQIAAPQKQSGICGVSWRQDEMLVCWCLGWPKASAHPAEQPLQHRILWGHSKKNGRFEATFEATPEVRKNVVQRLKACD